MIKIIFEIALDQKGKDCKETWYNQRKHNSLLMENYVLENTLFVLAFYCLWAILQLCKLYIIDTDTQTVFVYRVYK